MQLSLWGCIGVYNSAGRGMQGAGACREQGHAGGRVYRGQGQGAGDKMIPNIGTGLRVFLNGVFFILLVVPLVGYLPGLWVHDGPMTLHIAAIIELFARLCTKAPEVHLLRVK